VAQFSIRNPLARPGRRAEIIGLACALGLAGASAVVVGCEEARAEGTPHERRADPPAAAPVQRGGDPRTLPELPFAVLLPPPMDALPWLSAWLLPPADQRKADRVQVVRFEYAPRDPDALRSLTVEERSSRGPGGRRDRWCTGGSESPDAGCRDDGATPRGRRIRSRPHAGGGRRYFFSEGGTDVSFHFRRLERGTPPARPGDEEPCCPMAGLDLADFVDGFEPATADVLERLPWYE